MKDRCQESKPGKPPDVILLEFCKFVPNSGRNGRSVKSNFPRRSSSKGKASHDLLKARTSHSSGKDLLKIQHVCTLGLTDTFLLFEEVFRTQT